jgi:anti-sigma factor (TIGR02949 family)
MFSCKDSIHLLLDFLEGEMSPELSRELEEHLAGCPPCVDFMNTYRRTPAICKKALAAKMPEELSAKLTEFLRTHIRK